MVESSSELIQLQEEIEGDIIESTELFFDKIGAAVPLTSDDDFQFDLQDVPSRPIVVSERFKLVFVAHSTGFWVARTDDVVDLAMAIKEKGAASSIQELSIVDVQIGKVHILSLSGDSATFAASVGGDVHFFTVNSLMNKEQKPFYSCSLDDLACVKDMHWIKKLGTSFLLLSSKGKLYHGALEAPLKDVMDNVDAVEWSARGNLVAVARKNILSILSSKFKERFRMSLSFKTGGSDVNGTLQVDSIKWVRPDCIILGCLQLTADGMEENYLVQVITANCDKSTDGSSKPVVLSFCDLFTGLIDDILPPGSGPHLFLSYIEQGELAIAINRKNTDQHIVLIGWSKGDDNSKATVLDIARDKWLPRIELQENGDDNLVLGLSVDKVSDYGKVKVQIGVEEPRELPPYCVLFCLTLDGKVTIYRVASVAESAAEAPVDSIFPDEDDEVITPSMTLLKHDLSSVSSGSRGKKSEDVDGDLWTHDKNKEALVLERCDEISNKKDLNAFEWNISSASKPIVTGRQELKTLASIQPTQEPHKDLKLGQNQVGQQWHISGLQSTGYGSDPFMGKSKSDTSSHLNKDTQKFIEVGNELPEKSRVIGLPGGSSHFPSNGKSIPFRVSDAKSLVRPSSSVESHKFVNNTLSAVVTSANVPGDLSRTALFPKGTITQSAVTNSSTALAQIGGWRASTKTGSIEPLPSIRNSQFKFQDDKLPNLMLPTTVEKNRSPSPSGPLSVELKLSKQFGNIKDMTKELDALLEEAVSFRDASTQGLNNSLVALEQGVATLSEKCRVSKSTLDKRRTEVQNLLNKTVQVMARTVHIEGILKQATDSRYWDLWNLQKLSPELELKRRHILEINQDLTSQLIELERHFNTLELNKFGDDSGSYLVQKSQARYGASRKTQSLHSLHNTMNSQLAAAEQLSECLSKQMTLLSIESPDKRHTVKKDLFDSIGIPYDGASFNSPVALKANDLSSVKKLPSSSNSVAIKDQSRRKQSSLMKNNEPETARRRRDSLDRSWASYEPPKTTVKRSAMQEIQKTKGNKTLFSINNQEPRPHMLEGPVASQPIPHASSPFLYQSGNKGNREGFPKQAYESLSSSLLKRANDVPPPPSQFTGSVSPAPQIKKFQTFSFQSAPELSPVLSRSNVGDSNYFTTEKPRTDASFTGRFNVVPVNETSKNGLFGASSIPTRQHSHSPPALDKSTEISNSNGKGTFRTTSGGLEQYPVTNKSLSFESVKSNEVPSFGMSSTPVPKFSGWNFQNDTLPSNNQTGDKSFVPPASLELAQSSLPTLSSTAPASSATSSLNGSFTSANARVVANETVSSTSSSHASPIAKADVDVNQTDSSTSSSHTSPILSLGSFSSKANEVSAPLTIPSRPLTSAPESSLKDVQISAQKSSLKTDATVNEPAPSFAQAQLPTSPLKLGTSVPSSTPAIEVTTGIASGNQSSISSITSPTSSSAVLNAQPEKVAPEPTFSQAPLLTFPSTTAGKIDSSNNAVTQEDEMEEEAPETTQTAQLSLGNLGDFGLGSTPNSAAPKANPFGAPFGNSPVNPTSSSFTLTNPTGGLFRPASLSFPSPQPSHQPSVSSPFSGGFGMGGTAQQVPSGGGFGQPAQVPSGGGFGQPAQAPSGGGFGQHAQAPSGGGFGQPAQVGPGQQALGSVLGGFGQSRQLGAGLPGSGFAAPSSFGSGFAATPQTGGFANAATRGGFAGAASSGGGFAALASAGGGGFAGAASGGGGFAALASGGGGGFAGAASGGGFAGAAAGGGFPNAGGGFGAFNNQQGGGGFSAFGSAGTGKPQSELFTQLRR